MMKMTSLEKKMLEKLAELEHEQWILWSKAIAPEIDGRYYQKHLQRWKRLWVPYSELNESAKEQDREWARKVLAIFHEELGVVAQQIPLKAMTLSELATLHYETIKKAPGATFDKEYKEATKSILQQKWVPLEWVLGLLVEQQGERKMSALKIFGTGTPCFNCRRKMPEKTEKRMDKIRESYETPVWMIVDGWIEFYVVENKRTVETNWIFFYLCPKCVSEMMAQYKKEGEK